MYFPLEWRQHNYEMHRNTRREKRQGAPLAHHVSVSPKAGKSRPACHLTIKAVPKEMGNICMAETVVYRDICPDAI